MASPKFRQRRGSPGQEGQYGRWPVTVSLLQEYLQTPVHPAYLTGSGCLNSPLHPRKGDRDKQDFRVNLALVNSRAIGICLRTGDHYHAYRDCYGLKSLQHDVRQKLWLRYQSRDTVSYTHLTLPTICSV